MTTNRPTLHDEKRDLIRARLIEAAIDAFEEMGYVATTVADIVERAACSRPTFYLQFENKVSIMESVLDRAWPDPIEAGNRLMENLLKGLTRQDVRAAVEADLQEWRQRPGLLKAMLVATLTEPELANWVRDRHLAGIRRLESWTERLDPELSRTIQARILLLQNIDLMSYALPAQYNPHVSDEDVVDYLTELWFNGIVNVENGVDK